MTSSSKRRIFAWISLLVLAAGICTLIFPKADAVSKPQWKYVYLSEKGDRMICTDKINRSGEQYFLLHFYDFNTRKFGESVKIPIPAGTAKKCHYLGSSDKYLWLRTPELTAINIYTKKVLGPDELEKRICRPGQYLVRYLTSLTAEKLSPEPDENYNIYAYNQSGMRFAVDPNTLRIMEHPTYREIEKSTIHPMQFLSKKKDLSRQHYYQGATYKVANDPIIYELKPYYTIDDRDSIAAISGKKDNGDWSLFRIEYSPDKNTNIFSSYISFLHRQLVPRTFANARAIGTSGQKLVFIYQKGRLRKDPCNIAWYDTKTGKMTEKPIPHAEAMYDDRTPYFLYAVSGDGNYAIFSNGKDIPTRFRL